MQQFAIHINQQSEKWREKLVGFPGRKLLTVRRDDFIMGSSKNDWSWVTKELGKMISAELKTDLGKAVAPEFSTTTATVRTAFEIVLMKTTESYFESQLDTFCGIPAITLKGTQEDWEKLKQKVSILDEFGLTYWRKELDPILDEFVNATKGKADKAFWKKILKSEEKSGIGLVINGWIIKFFPYIIAKNSNKYALNPYLNKPFKPREGIGLALIPEGVSAVKFKWNYYEEFFRMEFVSGFMGTAEEPKDSSVRALIGWGIKNLDYSKMQDALILSKMK
jgi:hypothetical protein